MNSSLKISENSQLRPFLLLIALIWAFTACNGQNSSNNNVNANSSTSAANSDNAASVRDDIAELSSHVLLPVVPEEVKFLPVDVPNSNKKELTAIMKFTEEEAKNLVAQAEKHRPAETVEIGTEGWFPEELVAQSQLSGNESLKGTAYAPTDFLQMPYKTGKLVKIENSNYFILELSTE